jgi:hypothetical protein
MLSSVVSNVDGSSPFPLATLKGSGDWSAGMTWSLMVWNAAIYCTLVARNSILVSLR